MHCRSLVVMAAVVAFAVAGEPNRGGGVAVIDPTEPVVASGRYVYRQKDLDAFMLIAQRHAGKRFAGDDLERLRSAMIRMLVDREALAEAKTLLPASMPAKARDHLVLDLLDYQGLEAAAGGRDRVQGMRQPAVAIDAGPILIRLSPLSQVRKLATGRRQLTLGLALYFTDQALAKRMEAKAPVLQDAILAQVQQLADDQFVDPNQAHLKNVLTKAIIAKVPDFPADGLLIPQMESGAAE
jgi:hypothetical protein